LLAQSASEAKDFITRAMLIQEFARAAAGDARRDLGRRRNFLLMSPTRKYEVLPPTRDHQEALRDLGQTPAAGGYSTMLDVTGIATVIEQTIVEPTLQGLAATAFVTRFSLHRADVLQGRSSVLEFYCRLGDPETRNFGASGFDLAEE